MKKIKNGYTLVEIIVAVVILIVLSTLSYFVLGRYTKSSRDGVRINNLNTIGKLLDTYKMQNGVYPEPLNSLNITGTSGIENGISWKKGVFGGITMKELKKIPIDPSTKNNYEYMISNDGKYYKLEAVLESKNEKYIVSNIILD